MRIVFPYLFLISIFFPGSSFWAQKKQNFNFSDSIFEAGQSRVLNVLYNIGKASLHETSIPELDSIAAFLSKNKLKVVIECHSDSRGKSIAKSYRLTQARALAIVDSLKKRGITEKRLLAIGYEAEDPIFTDSQIQRTKSRAEQEAMHQKNRRTEMRILSLDYTRKRTFNLSDTSFYPGMYFMTSKIHFNGCEIKFTIKDNFLDSLVWFLNKNKGLTVEIGTNYSYGDCELSSRLVSLERANAITDSLVSRGIDKNRLVPKGYGSTRPIFLKETISKAPVSERFALEEKNRRVEIKIID